MDGISKKKLVRDVAVDDVYYEVREDVVVRHASKCHVIMRALCSLLTLILY